MQVFFFDVGQGDAALVVAPDGAALLIDGGGSFYADGPDPGRQVVAPALAALGVTRLEAVLMTHAHPDHIRGLLHVAETLDIAVLFHGNTELADKNVLQLFASAQRRGAEVVPIQTLTAAVPWHGLTLAFSHPRSPEGRGFSGRELNDNSAVLKVTHGAVDVLFAADIETWGEAHLAPTIGRAAVLKVAHHGGRTSSTEIFLEQVRPKDAVISCGVNNAFGVPHAEALERLELAGATVWRTDQQSHLHLTSDGMSYHIGKLASF